jgi:hypothetical protein
LRLTPAQRERRVTHAYHERVAPGARLGKHLDLLAAYEAELEQPPLHCGERGAARADPDHASTGARRQGREADEAWIKRKTGGCSDSVHEPQYE